MVHGLVMVCAARIAEEDDIKRPPIVDVVHLDRAALTAQNFAGCWLFNFASSESTPSFFLRLNPFRVPPSVALHRFRILRADAIDAFHSAAAFPRSKALGIPGSEFATTRVDFRAALVLLFAKSFRVGFSASPVTLPWRRIGHKKTRLEGGCFFACAGIGIMQHRDRRRDRRPSSAATHGSRDANTGDVDRF